MCRSTDSFEKFECAVAGGDMGCRLITGDCREVLRTLPDESVHCVVTSPPYWGLRDYGINGQLGLEASLGEYLDVMVEVFCEVRRVLRKDGTLWLNLGDSYAASVNGRSAADTKALGNDDRTFRDKPFSTIGPVYVSNARQTYDRKNPQAWENHQGRIVAGGLLKPKDLCGIPWRVAFALQADGWYLRQDIIWSKPNPMPESVRDRCTKAHEYIFLLSKSERYYYDQEAIKTKSDRAGEIGGTGPRSLSRNSADGLGVNRSGNAIEGGFCISPEMANKRSVWEVPTMAFSQGHFATFPPALIEPCILAGCPKGGTVLDPFFGAGTTGLVADRLERNCIGIELNPEYVAMAKHRIKDDAPLFAKVSEMPLFDWAAP